MAEYELFVQLIFLKSTIILLNYTIIFRKAGKIRHIPRLNSEFSYRFLVKSENYHLQLAVRNYYGPQECVTLKLVNLSKTDSFIPWNQKFPENRRRENRALAILFDEISNFWARIPPSRPVIVNKPIDQIQHFAYLGCDITYDYDYYVQKKLHKFQHLCGTIIRILKGKSRP